MGPLSRDEKVVAATFVGMVALWASAATLGLDSTAIAFLGLGVLLADRRADARGHRQGGGRPRDLHLVRGPLHAERPAQRAGLHGLPRPAAGGGARRALAAGAGLVLVVAYVLLHYLFVSQTAHLLALFGVFLDVGVKLGVPVAPLAFPLLFATNYFSVITPQGSSANLLFAGSGYLTQGELYRLGALTTVFNLLVYLLVGTTLAAARGALTTESGSGWTGSSTPLRENPELAIFLTLAIGFVLGRIRIGTFKLGNVVGTLLAGRARRPARDPVDAARQDRLLRPLPLRHRLQGRTPVLPRAQEGRAAAGVADRRPLRHEPDRDRDRGEAVGLRRRDRRGPHRRRLHRVDGHRHGRATRSTG